MFLVERLVAHRREDHEADEHDGTADQQDRTPTKPLDHPQRHDGHEQIDRAHDDLRGVTVIDPRGREDGISVEEDEVGARELLQGLEHDPQTRPPEHSRSREHLVPLGFARGFLLLVLLLHLLQLGQDLPMVDRDAREFGHDLLRLLGLALVVEETRRFGDQHDPETEDQGPCKSDSDGDSPRCRGVDSIGAEIDDVRDEDAECHE